jgi:curli biogenesis system outer membrane secretion channel CsgG
MAANQRIGHLALGLLAVALGCSCASVQPSATVTGGAGPGVAEARSVPYNGPKARITVAKFVDKSAKGYGAIGDGMTEMLTTALFSTNRFIVLERAELGAVLREQDLAASGRIATGTEAPIGEIEGAELLVVGAVTEFEPNAGGFAGGSTSGFAGVGVAGRTAHIAVDIRVIDARSSRILAAQSVEGRAQDVGGVAGIAAGPLAHGFGAFAKTPMEKAIRVCLQAAVNFIARQTPASYYHY